MQRYYLADVFTDSAFGGNPLAIFPESASLSVDDMRLIARELNLSETAFLMPPRDPAHCCRMRIFTPAIELPFAGHPTIGVACTLLERGLLGPGPDRRRSIVIEEEVGPVEVDVERRESGTFAALMAKQLPVFGPDAPAADRLAEMLGIDVTGIGGRELTPRAVSAGVPFLIVPVRTLQILGRVRLNVAVWQRILADFWAPHVYVIAKDDAVPGTVRARMFSPAMAIAEDPATGAAAAALAGYLAVRDRTGDTLRWRVRQGVEMGRPSSLDVEARRNGEVITAVTVGGHSVIVGEGVLYV